jgi:hypothetical protein
MAAQERAHRRIRQLSVAAIPSAPIDPDFAH